MNYTLRSISSEVYFGSGDTLRAAILDALTQLAQNELTSLAHGKSWCLQYVRTEVVRRKGKIFSQAADFDAVELMEMLAESRDFRLTGAVTPTRYPLANALASACGMGLTVVLNQWADAFLTAFGHLAVLIHQQEQAIAAINGAASIAALGEVMAGILEFLEQP